MRERNTINTEFTELMVRQELSKLLPMGVVWQEYLERQNFKLNYYPEIKEYEDKILKERV